MQVIRKSKMDHISSHPAVDFGLYPLRLRFRFIHGLRRRKAKKDLKWPDF
jgi:hypothetical protein